MFLGGEEQGAVGVYSLTQCADHPGLRSLPLLRGPRGSYFCPAVAWSRRSRGMGFTFGARVPVEKDFKVMYVTHRV